MFVLRGECFANAAVAIVASLRANGKSRENDDGDSNCHKLRAAIGLARVQNGSILLPDKTPSIGYNVLAKANARWLVATRSGAGIRSDTTGLTLTVFHISTNSRNSLTRRCGRTARKTSWFFDS